MEFFTQDDLNVTISSAMMTSNFKIVEHRFEMLYNYGNSNMGKHWRLFVMIKDSEEIERSMSFFSKFIPEDEEYKNFMIATRCFEKEVFFYSHLALVVKTLLPTELPLPIPMCHFARGESAETEISESREGFEACALVLQDLYPLGYQPMDMWVPLDLSHCRMVMRALAVFHGGSVLLQQRADQIPEYEEIDETILALNDGIFTLDEDSVSNQILHMSTETTATVICQLWPAMYPKEKFYNKLVRILWNSWKNVISMQLSGVHTKVVCHGELCGNNVMFAYDRAQRGVQAPVDVKFVDMQQIRNAAPITDILIFLHVCTTCKFRKENLSELLSYYYMEFVRAVSPKVASETQSLEALKTSAENMREFGLMAAIFFLPICLTHNPIRGSAASFHFCSTDVADSKAQRESKGCNTRYSMSISMQECQVDTYSLMKNQSSRILELMEENQLFKSRLSEAYEEYLEFVGLWRNRSLDQKT